MAGVGAYFNPETGQWEEIYEPVVDPDLSPIPIGLPRYSGEERGNAGWPEIPSPTEGASSAWDTPLAQNYTGPKPQLFASNEPGVPADYSQDIPEGYQLEGEEGVATTFGHNDPDDPTGIG